MNLPLKEPLMRYFQPFIRRLAILCAIALLGLAAGCSKPADKPTGAATGTSNSQQQASSKLGDLSGFRTIAAEVAALVERNDLPGAKIRIKDLETSWDSAEAGIKPRAAADWHVVDKAIDRALDALRTSSPNLVDCKAAMANLLQAFDSMQGQP